MSVKEKDPLHVTWSEFCSLSTKELEEKLTGGCCEGTYPFVEDDQGRLYFIAVEWKPHK